jgi:hypothetical protein
MVHLLLSGHYCVQLKLLVEDNHASLMLALLLSFSEGSMTKVCVLLPVRHIYL